MKLLEKEKQIISNFDNSKNFTIQANSKAFQILSNNLYSNKIQAVIRELSINAYDAHVEAGKKDAPFEVHLPNELEPWFHVKDWGPGMGEEKIMELYSSYFASDKTESNDFVGALGLGSKSPFAYTETFTIKSIQNNIERVYTCYLDEFNIPTIGKIAETSCKQESGFLVRFGVRGIDFQRFKEAAKVVFKAFDSIPNVVGVEEFNVKHYFECDESYKNIREMEVERGSDWVIKEQRCQRIYMSTIIVIQGNVAYSIRRGDLNIENEFNDTIKKEIYDSILKRYFFAIKFPIGKLDVAPSREALSYDERTTSNIKNKIVSIVDEIYQNIENAFKPGMTKWEIIKEYNNIGYIWLLHRDRLENWLKKNNYNTKAIFEIPSSYAVKYFSVQKKIGSYASNYEARYVPKHTPINNFKLGVLGTRNIKIFTNDEKKESRGIYKLKQNMRKYNFNALVIPENYARELGINGDLERTTELEYIRKPGANKKSKNTNSDTSIKYRICNAAHQKSLIEDEYSYYDFKNSSLFQNSTEVYYVYMYRKYMTNDDTIKTISQSWLNKFITFLKEREIIDDNFTYVIVDRYETKKKRFKKMCNKMRPLLPYLFNQFIDYYNREDVKKSFRDCQKKLASNRYLSYHMERTIQMLIRIEEVFNHTYTGSIRNLIDSYNPVLTDRDREIGKELSTVSRYIQVIEAYLKVAPENLLNISTENLINKCFNEVLNEYEALKIIDPGQVSRYRDSQNEKERLRIVKDLLEKK
jgi:hypothetical protein